MNDVERLLRQDRVAGVPEPPDLRYTEAVVRRRLGQGSVIGPARPAGNRAGGFGDWWMVASAVGLIAPLAWFLSYVGLSPWWLAVLPLSLLPLTPLLMLKERERS